MPDPKFVVSVNGQPLRQVIAEEIRVEANRQMNYEVQQLSRTVHSHIISSRMSNHSGARSGRGRVIYSRGY